MTATQRNYEIYLEAHNAGMAAGRNVVCTPVRFTQHENPLDDNSRVVHSEVVNDGVCGFAWIKVPGNQSFGKWAKKYGMTIKDPYNGLLVRIEDRGEFGQSMQRKEAYAEAFAAVLNKYGFKAYAKSRID